MIIGKGNVREVLLNTCEAIKPNIVLIGPPFKRSKKLLDRSVLSYIRKHVKNIPVLTYTDNDELHREVRNNKIGEPQVSKQSKSSL